MHKVDQLVLEIKAGKSELTEALWKEVYGYVKWCAHRRLALCDPYHRQFLEDMIQESFLQMMKALSHFAMPEEDSANSAFLSLLSFYLRNGFNIILDGGRTKKKRLDPINSAVSLDMNVSDEGSMPLSEVLLDFDSQLAFERIEDAEYWRSVRELILQGILTLEPLQQRIFTLLLNESSSIMAAQKKLGMTEATTCQYREAYRRGLAKLRIFLKRKAAEYDNYGISIKGAGVRSFKENNYTSVVEKAVIRRWEKASARGPVCPLRDE